MCTIPALFSCATPGPSRVVRGGLRSAMPTLRRPVQMFPSAGPTAKFVPGLRCAGFATSFSRATCLGASSLVLEHDPPASRWWWRPRLGGERVLRTNRAARGRFQYSTVNTLVGAPAAGAASTAAQALVHFDVWSLRARAGRRALGALCAGTRTRWLHSTPPPKRKKILNKEKGSLLFQ